MAYKTANIPSCNHAMTRHDHRKRIGPAGLADGLGSAAQLRGNGPVCLDLTQGDATDGIPDAPLKCRPGVCQWQIEALIGTFDPARELNGCTICKPGSGRRFSRAGREESDLKNAGIRARDTKCAKGSWNDGLQVHEAIVATEGGGVQGRSRDALEVGAARPEDHADPIALPQSKNSGHAQRGDDH